MCGLEMLEAEVRAHPLFHSMHFFANGNGVKVNFKGGQVSGSPRAKILQCALFVMREKEQLEAEVDSAPVEVK